MRRQDLPARLQNAIDLSLQRFFVLDAFEGIDRYKYVE